MLYFTYLDVRPMFDGEKLRSALAELAPERAQRVLEVRGYAARARRMGGELLLHYLYEKSEEEFSDLTRPDLGFPEISETEYGKPYFAHRADIEFNISHSGSVAVCALNRVSNFLSASQVGVDVELVGTKTPEQMKKIAARFFLREERKILNRAMSEEEYIHTFTKIWVRKESIVKCLGTGLRDITLADSTCPEKHGLKLSDKEIYITENTLSNLGGKRQYLAAIAEHERDYIESEADAEFKRRNAMLSLANLRDEDIIEFEDDIEDISPRKKDFFNFEL